MGSFPDTYLCVDTEYTSNGENGKLLEFGWAAAKNNEVTSNNSVVLNWYSVAGLSKRDLDYDLGRLGERIPGWRFTPAHLREVGGDPQKVLVKIHKWLDAWRLKGSPFVAQNGITADERVLRHAFKQSGMVSFEFPENKYLDTGGLFLAEQIWAAKDPAIAAFRQAVLPQPSETLKDYFKRLRSLRVGGVRWNLDCILTTYNIQIPESTARHTAAYDALCLHYVMQHVGSLLRKYEQ